MGHSFTVHAYTLGITDEKFSAFVGNLKHVGEACFRTSCGEPGLIPCILQAEMNLAFKGQDFFLFHGFSVQKYSVNAIDSTFSSESEVRSKCAGYVYISFSGHFICVDYLNIRYLRMGSCVLFTD